MPPKLKSKYRAYGRYFVNVKSLYGRKDIVVYTGLTLSLFTIAFFGFFALKPTLITIASLIKEIDEKKEINIKLEKKLGDLRVAQNNYSLAASSRPLANESLPAKPLLSQVTYQLEALAQHHGLTINSLGFDKVVLVNKQPDKTPQKDSGPKEIIFSASLAGSYESLSFFLTDLESLRRIVKVSSFTFSKTEKEEIVVVRLNLNGKVFFEE